MRHLLQENVIPALWIIFALYWVLAAVRQKRANQPESLLTRLCYVVLAATAFLFLLYYKDSIEVLWILLGLYVAFARPADQRCETTPIAFYPFTSPSGDDRRVHSPPRKAGAFRLP